VASTVCTLICGRFQIGRPAVDAVGTRLLHVEAVVIAGQTGTGAVLGDRSPAGATLGVALSRVRWAARLGLSHVPYLSARNTRLPPRTNRLCCGNRQFPSAALVPHGADLIPHLTVEESDALEEGPRWEIVVSPGVSASATGRVTYRRSTVRERLFT